jgi:hypothetical protein
MAGGRPVLTSVTRYSGGTEMRPGRSDCGRAAVTGISGQSQGLRSGLYTAQQIVLLIRGASMFEPKPSKHRS